MSWLYSLVFAGLLFGSNGSTAVTTHQNAVAPAPATEVAVKGDEIEKFEQSYPLSKNGNVSVSNVNGSIVVEAWDRNEVRLEATKIADTKEALSNVDIKVEANADSFSVEADYKPWKWNDRQGDNRGRKLEVQFKLSVPAGAVLNEIETVNGDVTVSNFTNVTKISAVNGDVSATNLRGAAHLSTVNGKVTADFDRVDTASKINLNTVNGGVSLLVPSDLNATIKADSLNGNITNDFGLPVKKGQYVGRDLYGKVGNGETQIKLSSVNGPLSISRKNDGRNPNPATNLLPSKKADDDIDIDVDMAREEARNAAQINREVARSVRESTRVTAKSMKDAQKAIEMVGPTMEKLKLDELEKLDKEKLKIDFDQKEMERQIQRGMDQQRAAMDRMSQAVWFGGTPTVEKKRNSFAVKGTPKVSVEAKGCSVSIRGWDKEEVSYVITEMATRRSAPAQVTEDHTPSAVTLKVINNDAGSPQPFQLSPERVRIEVFVPRKSNLKIVTDGELRLDGVSGEIDLKGDDGAINIRDVDGNMNIVADQAQVRVIGFKGDLDSQTACGDVFLEGNFKKLSAKATDGTVTLTLPSDANATLTSNTEVESDGIDVVQEDDETWRVGKGGAKYTFNFNDGKLVVRSTEAVSSN
ncbi:MAG TPA: DUF4097 family beta strand repeat-containing protein [Pyrinomonadaceae bacterium]|nr:DUF4097 family beta strand repeat-containing protein [Pyrinomonadaceae bacterium]